MGNRPLRVALVDPSGYSRPYDHELARALHGRGHRVTLWTSAFVHGDAPAAAGYEVREHFYRRSNAPARWAAGCGRRRRRPSTWPTCGGWARSCGATRPTWCTSSGACCGRSSGSSTAVCTPPGFRVVFTAHDPVPNVGGAGPAALGGGHGALVRAGHLPQRVGPRGARRPLRRRSRPRAGDPARRVRLSARAARRRPARRPRRAAGRRAGADPARTRAWTCSCGPGRACASRCRSATLLVAGRPMMDIAALADRPARRGVPAAVPVRRRARGSAAPGRRRRAAVPAHRQLRACWPRRSRSALRS